MADDRSGTTSLSAYEVLDVTPIRRIGSGTYGVVEEVTIPTGTVCAAKRIHDHLTTPWSMDEFASECKLMSSLRHPNVVQFYGICYFPSYKMPAIVMERMVTSLHQILVPEKIANDKGKEEYPNPERDRDKSVFPLERKLSILYNVAEGLHYLHERKVVHRNMTAKNILLTAGMVAKIADLAEARAVEAAELQIYVTKCGGAHYFLPEAEKYTRSIDFADAVPIDSFSFGVITIFIIGEEFPDNLLSSTYLDTEWRIHGRTELQRREKYISNVKKKLAGTPKLDLSPSEDAAQGEGETPSGDHPMVTLIEECLQNLGSKRPDMKSIKERLRKMGAEKRSDVMELLEASTKLKSELKESKVKNKELLNVNTKLESQLKEIKAKNEEITRELKSEKIRAEMLEEVKSELQKKDEEISYLKEQLLKEDENLRHPMTGEGRPYLRGLRFPPMCDEQDLPSLRDTPTLPLLMSYPTDKGAVNILQKIEDYYKLGVLLLNDDNGSRVRGIEGIGGKSAPIMCREIIIEWLNTGTSPLTWTTLLGVIDKIKPHLVSSLKIKY